MTNVFLFSWLMNRSTLLFSSQILHFLTKCFLISCFMALMIAPISPLSAKELPQRLGLGIKNNASFNMPTIAAVYYPNREIGITSGVGIDTQKDYSRFSFDVGARRIVFREEQLNFYFGGQLALVNYEEAAVKSSGFDLNALFGVEFFFAGIENLGFSVEGGVGVSSMKNTRFRTLADGPLRAGIIFYF